MTEATADNAATPPTRRSQLAGLVNGIFLLRETWAGMIGATLVLAWLFIAFFAPWISPFPPNATLLPFSMPGADAPGGGVFLLGTDHIGRDILSRIFWGSRTVLIYASLATFSANLVGIVLGLAAGYYRGWIDEALSRLADIVLSFPVMVLYIIIIALLGASGLNIILAVTFITAPAVMRIVRGLVLDVRERDYISAAQMRGENPWFIMFVEILPNVRGPLIVEGCLRMGYVTITIGTLGFLGLGLPPPDPDWGGMINETRSMALVFPHMTLFPSLAISSLVLGLNLLADGIREISLNT